MQVPHSVSQHLDVDLATKALNRMKAVRTILFICSPGTISTAMTAAIESEFPWLSVKTVPSLPSALTEFDNPVELVMADVALAHVIKEHWHKLARLHAGATLAFIGNDDEVPAANRIEDLEFAQGVVPFNVNLDVFLSALRIILKGGTYFPSNHHQQHRSPSWEGIEDRTEMERTQPSLGRSSAQMIDKLTKRETEILARIAMGNQNKIIAAALGLSEHTVKIHIHNIITKLGVHNRTEVVALYFEHRRKDSAGNAPESIHRQDGGSLPGDKL